jgi:hypothetical protein
LSPKRIGLANSWVNGIAVATPDGTAPMRRRATSTVHTIKEPPRWGVYAKEDSDSVIARAVQANMATAVRLRNCVNSILVPFGLWWVKNWGALGAVKGGLRRSVQRWHQLARGGLGGGAEKSEGD